MISKKLATRLESFLSKEDLEQVMNGYSTERVSSFRINTLKSNKEEVESILCTKNISFTELSFPPHSYIIAKKDEFSLKGSDAFYGGKIYLQGITSQIPATLLGAKKGDLIFDVTAAPGSKTTQIAAIMENTGTIIACEKHQIRHDKLKHNIVLQGATNIETHKMDALNLVEFLKKESFDAVLLDAPCSAEGRIQIADERTYGFWSMKNIYEKAEIQKQLLEASIPLLKKGGILVYSTCTLAPEENEGVVSDILSKHKELVLEDIETLSMDHVRNGIQEFEGTAYHKDIAKTIRILPSNITEGFYVAKFKKI